MYNLQRERVKLLGAASDLVFHNFGGWLQAFWLLIILRCLEENTPAIPPINLIDSHLESLGAFRAPAQAASA